MNTIKINSISEMPKNFTGIVEYSTGTKVWYINGKRHRINGPAVEYPDGYKVWCIEDNSFNYWLLEFLIRESIFLGKEKGRYGLEWLKFMTEYRIKEFPVIQGMKEDKEFKELLEKLGKEIEATIP